LYLIVTKKHEKLINYLIMSPLVKTIIKSAAAVIGAVAINYGIKKVAPTALPVDPFSGNTAKTWLWLTGFIVAGSLVAGLAGKFFKITALKN
jgi:hypothetical protein